MSENTVTHIHERLDELTGAISHDRKLLTTLIERINQLTQMVDSLQDSIQYESVAALEQSELYPDKEVSTAFQKFYKRIQEIEQELELYQDHLMPDVVGES